MANKVRISRWGINQLWCACCVAACLSGPMLAVARADEITAQVGSLKTGRQILSARLRLSAEGLWHIKAVGGTQAVEAYLTPRGTVSSQQIGRRMLGAQRTRQIQAGQWIFNTLYSQARRYAQHHSGRGPTTIADLDQEYLNKNWDKPLWRSPASDQLDHVEGPFRFLIPNARFNFSQSDGRRSFFVEQEDREVLAVELRPFVDDGKHWVVYTDGRRERREPDQEIIERYNLEIRPVLTKEVMEARNGREVEYQLLLTTESVSSQIVTVQVTNPILRESCELHLRVDTSKPGHADLKDPGASLGFARAHAWRAMIASGGGEILQTWLGKTGSEPVPGRNTGRRTSAFSVLGGRAAIEETLQMQDLAAASTAGEKADEKTVPLASLTGVKVQSHPFKKMLGGNPGGRLQLADYVPADRFFLYVRAPEVVLPLLGSGGSFAADVGAIVTGNRLHYGLVDRYLRRMGLDQQLVRAVLQADVLQDFAITSTDLLFIDGTDVTLVARLKQPKLLAGLIGATAGETIQRKTESGVAYWTIGEEVLVISTSRDELDRTQALVSSKGQGTTPGSLGQSDEFRYMLTKLAVEPDTQAYAYFSDPFIRRMVGPEVKLKQRRRLVAKARLEVATAQVLLAKLEGAGDKGAGAKDARELVDLGYWHEQWPNDLKLQADGSVVSHNWGTLQRMKTLSEIDLEQVSASEAQAYQQYVDNYSRYWRQFFDPIAIRLSKSKDSYELETFILPLVDNTIYNGLRDFLVHSDGGPGLEVPQISPRPVLTASFNMREQAWVSVADSFADFFANYSGVSSAILDDLGTSLHLAIHDADPVLVLGSGDVLGAFGSNVLDSGTMVMLPVVASVLTRPCTVFVETQDPQRTARFLRASAASGGMRTQQNRWFRSAFYQVEDEDRWVWTVDLLGAAKLRFGVAVQGKFLTIRNIPWSESEEISTVVASGLNGAEMKVNPGAFELQLPSLHAAATDSSRRSTFSGLTRLAPILMANPKMSVQAALNEHQRLFGFSPRSAPADDWSWNGRELVSTEFGTAKAPRQPKYDPSKPFGLMQRVEQGGLSMQFEDDGLRSRIRWQLKAN